MSFPLLQFVTAPEVDADVLYDFHSVGVDDEADRYPQALDFTLGTPSLDDDADVDAVDPVYGVRTPEFTQLICGTKAQALAVQSLLARQVLAPTGWLLFQLDADRQPMWLRTYRATPGEMSLDGVAVDDVPDGIVDDPQDFDWWEVKVSIPAEPFAYGKRITLPPFTISNDPAAAGACHIVLPDVVGDAPAPARIQIVSTDRTVSTTNRTGRRRLLGVHSAPTVHAPVVWQIGTGDIWTPGPDVSAPTTDGDYSGGSYRTVSFATSEDLEARLTGTAAALTPGRYKVLLRATPTDTASVFTFQMQTVIEGPTIYQSTRVASDYPNACWIDLGSMALPPGGRLPETTAVAAATPFYLLIGRTSGAGSLRLDAIMLIPEDLPDTIDNRVLLSSHVLAPAADTTSLDTWDGDAALYVRLTPDGDLVPAAQAQNTGGFPNLQPGVQNVFTFLQHVSPTALAGTDGSPDRIADTAQVTVSYQPLVLWIRDTW